ncbi:Vitamin K-dependent gamma-carboxylase [Fulvivirga imtechensis AK7]|uniref:Vitamin K-dependent gamma-carboxylase n=1 Tax=Fulvivirga imtechensis AK7 TaxID=1237149 RepID=L8JRV8_9BACT|nr:HTTM domain-containing protein [Fulvivirga imtechensis]ELR71600.1 Vitamin K-dependent gamma-carboxylase [Fulvivirga imtechensis AK7]
MIKKLNDSIYKPFSIAPLAVFRVLFGFVMFVSVIRFMLNGWVRTQYLDPKFYFPYYGFEWIKPLGEAGIYSLFVIMALSALGVMLGSFYRISAALFFVAFTYVELIDKTNYLNHYYFVSLVSLVMVFLPAHRGFSLDVLRKPALKLDKIPYWCVLIIQLQLAVVYFYAGVAKLNYDWLVEALPLRMWLLPHTHLPVIGGFLDKLWVAYFFSWFGAVYDLSIPFLLFNGKTRTFAYLAVVAFHILTWLLFPIGMFPFIMILATLIFFKPDFHQRFIQNIIRVLQRLRVYREAAIARNRNSTAPVGSKLVVSFFAVFLLIQILLPWRFLLYPGELFWTEQGYRFSWRVMLMEKAGYTIFHITDPENGRSWEAYAHDYLTPMQEKQMSTQPDMILQYAQFLEREYIKQGVKNPEIRVEAYVTLNGRGSRLLIDPKIDLTKEKEGFHHKNWILSYSK